MIPAAVEINSTATTVSASDTTKMSIDQSSLVHLMTVLSNLYSDPISAVIREYSTNALDSHIEAGINRPIEVTLPTTYEPTFLARDFGVGLSVEDLKNVYSLYGASTKRESEEAVGMLGLGCKSAFTYTIGFTVTSVKDGRKVLASVAKDDDGVGAIRILDEFDTDEPNGVSISVPVRSYDVWDFEHKANHFFSFWKSGSVLVNGAEPSFVTDESTLWLDDDIAVINGGTSYIVQGNVAYPFQPVGNFSAAIVAWVPMGSVNFTPSRESLHLTSRTKETIATISAFVSERFENALKERLAAAQTEWDRILVASSWRYTGAARVYLNTAITLPRSAFEYSVWSRTNGTTTPRSQVTLGYLANSATIITDFPIKNVGPAHRRRLKAFGHNALILPEGADLTYLVGRPSGSVFTWQDVLDNTPEPEKAKRIKKVGDIYNFRYDGTSFTQELDSSKPIAWAYGTNENNNYVAKMICLFPKVQIVLLYANQIEKFERLFPKAAYVGDLYNKEKAKAAAAITDADKLSATSVPHVLSQLTSLASAIDDPRFTTIANISRTQSATLVRARALDINIPAHPIYSEILASYPLLPYLDGGYSSFARSAEAKADIITYINAKYSSNVTNTTNNNKGDSK